MKNKLLSILLAASALLLLMLCVGCTKTQDDDVIPVADNTPDDSKITSTLTEFPKGSVLLGVNLSGLDAGEATSALRSVIRKYTLSITIGDTVTRVTADDLGLTLADVDFPKLMEMFSKDKDARSKIEKDLVQCSEDAVTDVVNALPGLESSAKNASLFYNTSTGKFDLQKDEDGFGIDLDSLKETIMKAACAMAKNVNVEMTNSLVKARITKDGEIAQQALKDANAIFDLDLRFSYTPSNGSTTVERLSKDQILNLIYIKNGLELAVDTDALNQYVSQMASLHNMPGSNVRFKTTGGGYLDVNIQTTGDFVDTEQLYNDILNCLTNRISGTRTVAYYQISADQVASNYGGNYVEINLSAQHLWIYRNSQCVLSTDIVSGNVSGGHNTPTGVYSIYEMEREIYLVGPTWKSFVYYWMAFNGSVGMHDATWRSNFGGDIYLGDGSHGCVNMPYSAAATAYNNVYVGMPVIVYGGSNVADPQTVTGKSSYTVTNGAAPFTLDAKPRYSAKLVYSSDNKKVATVDSNGKVTIVGPGTAKITVTTEENASAKLVVTVTVKPNDCDLGNHKWNAGQITKAPSCAEDGVITYTCTVCGKTKTEPLEATGHAWTEWETVLEPSCTQPGLRSRTCNQCHENETQEIPVTDHEYENGKCKWCEADDPSYENSSPDESSEEE